MFEKTAKGIIDPETGMNRLETAYARHLELLRQRGEILNWAFEPEKLRIAKNCWYSPDFRVQRLDGSLEFHEVKGSPAIFRDDAKVKVRVCAERHPYKLFVVFPVPKKLGGGWRFEAFN